MYDEEEEDARDIAEEFIEEEEEEEEEGEESESESESESEDNADSEESEDNTQGSEDSEDPGPSIEDLQAVNAELTQKLSEQATMIATLQGNLEATQQYNRDLMSQLGVAPGESDTEDEDPEDWVPPVTAIESLFNEED